MLGILISFAALIAIGGLVWWCLGGDFAEGARGCGGCVIEIIIGIILIIVVIFILLGTGVVA